MEDQKKQDNPVSDEKDTKTNILDKLSEQLSGEENGDKVLDYIKKKISGDETEDEILAKVVKSAFNAEKKITDQGTTLSEVQKLLTEKRKIEKEKGKEPEPKNGEKITDSDEVKEALKFAAELVEKNKQLEAEHEGIKMMYKEIKDGFSEMSAAQMSYIIAERDRRLDEGYKDLTERVGEEIANKYYNPDNRKDSMIYKTLDPNTNERTAKLAPALWSMPNTFEAAFMLVADDEDKKTYLETKAPHIEGAGKGGFGEATPEEQALQGVADFMGVTDKKEQKIERG